LPCSDGSADGHADHRGADVRSANSSADVTSADRSADVRSADSSADVTSADSNADASSDASRLWCNSKLPSWIYYKGRLVWISLFGSTTGNV
jgi:hypothetical protein